MTWTALNGRQWYCLDCDHTWPAARRSFMDVSCPRCERVLLRFPVPVAQQKRDAAVLRSAVGLA